MWTFIFLRLIMAGTVREEVTAVMKKNLMVHIDFENVKPLLFSIFHDFFNS